jgi:hypothetical protein
VLLEAPRLLVPLEDHIQRAQLLPRELALRQIHREDHLASAPVHPRQMALLCTA